MKMQLRLRVCIPDERKYSVDTEAIMDPHLEQEI